MIRAVRRVRGRDPRRARPRRSRRRRPAPVPRAGTAVSRPRLRLRSHGLRRASAQLAARTHQTITARPSSDRQGQEQQPPCVGRARPWPAGARPRWLGAAPVPSARMRPALGRWRRVAMLRGVDAARARQAVLGLKPHHRGAGARAEPAVDRTGPVAAAHQAPLDLAHAARAVPGWRSRCRGRRRPPTTRAGTARRHRRVRSPATDRGSRARASPPTRAGHCRPRTRPVRSSGLSAAASAARGHLQSISSPDQSSVCPTGADAGRGAWNRDAVQPGRSSREMNGTGRGRGRQRDQDERRRRRSTPATRATATGRRRGRRSRRRGDAAAHRGRSGSRRRADRRREAGRARAARASSSDARPARRSRLSGDRTGAAAGGPPRAEPARSCRTGERSVAPRAGGEVTVGGRRSPGSRRGRDRASAVRCARSTAAAGSAPGTHRRGRTLAPRSRRGDACARRSGASVAGRGRHPR